MYSLVCVGPGRKFRRPVLSQRGSYAAYVCFLSITDIEDVEKEMPGFIKVSFIAHCLEVFVSMLLFFSFLMESYGHILSLKLFRYSEDWISN